jgi:hypothetical protein
MLEEAIWRVSVPFGMFLIRRMSTESLANSRAVAGNLAFVVKEVCAPFASFKGVCTGVACEIRCRFEHRLAAQ